MLFFGFPLRNNGLVSNACKRLSDGNIVGNAYYHQNIWAIVCDFNTAYALTYYPINSIYDGVVGTLLRI